MAYPVDYIGVTRFSVVAPKHSGLLIDQSDRETYLKNLFDSERMELRSFIFSELAAPSYQRMAERHSYKHLVQYSPELPDSYKQLLFDVAKTYSAIEPVEVVDMDIADSIKTEVQSWGKKYRGHFLWFRVDDDDLLSVDFLDALERYRDPAFTGMAILYPRVVSAIIAHGSIGFFREEHHMHHHIGVAYGCRANNNLGTFESIGMISSDGIHKALPTVWDATEPMGLWFRHVNQDSWYGSSKVGAKLANLQAKLAEAPAFPITKVADKFPTVVQHINSRVHAERPEIAKTLRLKQWSQIENEEVQPLPEGYWRADYTIDFQEKPHDRYTLCFEFADPQSTDAWFPRTAERGDYRRLYVDSFGHGTIFFYIPKDAVLTRIRVLCDGAQEDSLVKIVMSPLGV